MENARSTQTEAFKKRLYSFTIGLIAFIDQLPKDNVSRRIGDQLLRSGTSVLANFVEGQSASSRKDFANFFNHSLKSANESKIWLALLCDSKRVSAEKTRWYLNELEEFVKIFASSIITLRRKK